MSYINLIHTVFSVLALISGAVVIIQTKGTITHKRYGYTYFISMLILIATSFMIFDLFEGFGAYHVLAIVSLVTLFLGMFFPLFKRNYRGWLIQHYMWMSYSYVGLVMAGGSHLFAMVPNWPSWLSILLFWVLPYVVGSILIFKNRKKILQDIKERYKMDIVVR
ncbi:DUF2306 domain-containing protein [Leeuwenhoekiella marinoflava]|uniref:DUF2306 domain-containing protein n=1 Tax=Leeuwenhoekiella marinoflava TaxID=988 RepID=UPI003002B52B